MKLFLINTPLQAIIAARIIELEQLELHDCSLVYVCDEINEKYTNSYLKIASLNKFSTFIPDIRSISGIKKLRSFIKNIGIIDCVYLACIDDTIAHYAISFANSPTLKTFDDGTANILPGSSYFIDKKTGSIRSSVLKLFHRMNGNVYNMKKIKNESIVHYSIYPEFANVMNNVKHIQIFGDEPIKKDVCHLFNGVNYSNYCKSKKDARSLKSKIYSFLKSLDGDVIYTSVSEKDQQIFSNYIVKHELIDIEYVNSLRKRYKVINIYGFADYMQNLLIDDPGIVIHPIYSDLLLGEVNECSRILSSRCKIDSVCL
ncbi:glycosyltransferase family 52 [Enterobacter cloacae]|uniref:glycosyltransferase family 52 n=1 Tax=Enterobacter cloacae TaxID=550 RepID=UPI000F81C9F4|nr:glycosyltransferase family 52 [Enterobacter cloacae]MCJ8538509.1 glycosyltransferase family 52 protein [Enterobacter cloacae]MCQ4409431.1 glycosyltransferase family 52 protein [Enterobacter cloacae]MDV0879180.1 glycosyltransferase family 52 [Enterobacter cloacae]MDV0894128.1 glycosyltransferase family 52 [Enterobacter cloacae]MDV0966251.1 glycosyltransferase family 52 [Enterobacter cloacae]